MPPSLRGRSGVCYRRHLLVICDEYGQVLIRKLYSNSPQVTLEYFIPDRPIEGTLRRKNRPAGDADAEMLQTDFVIVLSERLRLSSESGRC